VVGVEPDPEMLVEAQTTRPRMWSQLRPVGPGAR
jgi:hypothetical protein